MADDTVKIVWGHDKPKALYKVQSLLGLSYLAAKSMFGLMRSQRLNIRCTISFVCHTLQRSRSTPKAHRQERAGFLGHCQDVRLEQQQ